MLAAVDVSPSRFLKLLLLVLTEESKFLSSHDDFVLRLPGKHPTEGLEATKGLVNTQHHQVDACTLNETGQKGPYSPEGIGSSPSARSAEYLARASSSDRMKKGSMATLTRLKTSSFVPSI